MVVLIFLRCFSCKVTKKYNNMQIYCPKSAKPIKTKNPRRRTHSFRWRKHRYQMVASVRQFHSNLHQLKFQPMHFLPCRSYVSYCLHLCKIRISISRIFAFLHPGWCNIPRRGMKRFWGDLEGKFGVSVGKMLMGDEFFQSLTRKTEKIRA